MRRNYIAEAKKYKVAYAFIAPAFVGMLLLHFLPLVQGIYMSFLKLNQFTLFAYLGAPYVGLRNYSDALFNPASPMRLGLGHAALNTLIYGIVVTIGTISIGMIVALMLNRKFFGRALVRTFFIFPWVIPQFVVGILWGFMWQQNNGVINVMLYDWFKFDKIMQFIGFHVSSTKPFWLSGDPRTLVAIILPTMWRGWPLSMLMLLAGLQGISQDYYEAADIDGANGWQKFWQITFPLLKPVWSILILFGMIFNFYSFNIVYMMFGNGAGFPGDWGDLIMVNIFRNAFLRYDFGTGAAVSVMLMTCMISAVLVWYSFYKNVEKDRA
ncbi:MAG: sugar ABC transporter permease [Candidatus Margulisiibacteriota bacterium]|jgi:multiple sugar transport system permease protein